MNHPLTPLTPEEGGKLVRKLFFGEKAMASWEDLPDSARKGYCDIFQQTTEPFRQKIEKQTTEQQHLYDLYFKTFKLLGGKPDDNLDSLPQLASRVRTLLVRARCGCLTRDCVKHGSWIAENVDLWQQLVFESFPPPEQLKPSNPPPLNT